MDTSKGKIWQVLDSGEADLAIQLADGLGWDLVADVEATLREADRIGLAAVSPLMVGVGVEEAFKFSLDTPSLGWGLAAKATDFLRCCYDVMEVFNRRGHSYRNGDRCYCAANVSGALFMGDIIDCLRGITPDSTSGNPHLQYEIAMRGLDVEVIDSRLRLSYDIMGAFLSAALEVAGLYSAIKRFKLINKTWI